MRVSPVKHVAHPKYRQFLVYVEVVSYMRISVQT